MIIFLKVFLCTHYIAHDDRSNCLVIELYRTETELAWEIN